MLDAYGAKVTRVFSLVTFSAACLLFAFSSRTFDAYLPAAGLISCGGMGFFFSHFVLALHFRNDHYGLVHAIINCAFDGSTVTFTVLEQLHRTLNTSIRNLFVGMACIAALFLLLSTELVWNGHLDAPKEEDNAFFKRLEVPLPLTHEALLDVARKKFKSVTKQSRLYDGASGEEITAGAVVPGIVGQGL